MVGVGELVENGRRGDAVRIVQGRHVVPQGLLVAGDVQDAVEIAGELNRGIVQAGARRVDEQRAVAEGVEVDGVTDAATTESITDAPAEAAPLTDAPADTEAANHVVANAAT